MTTLSYQLYMSCITHFPWMYEENYEQTSSHPIQDSMTLFTLFNMFVKQCNDYIFVSTIIDAHITLLEQTNSQESLYTKILYNLVRIVLAVDPLESYDEEWSCDVYKRLEQNCDPCIT